MFLSNALKMLAHYGEVKKHPSRNFHYVHVRGGYHVAVWGPPGTAAPVGRWTVEEAWTPGLKPPVKAKCFAVYNGDPVGKPGHYPSPTKYPTLTKALRKALDCYKSIQFAPEAVAGADVRSEATRLTAHVGFDAGLVPTADVHLGPVSFCSTDRELVHLCEDFCTGGPYGILLDWLEDHQEARSYGPADFLVRVSRTALACGRCGLFTDGPFCPMVLRLAKYTTGAERVAGVCGRCLADKEANRFMRPARQEDMP